MVGIMGCWVPWWEEGESEGDPGRVDGPVREEHDVVGALAIKDRIEQGDASTVRRARQLHT